MKISISISELLKSVYSRSALMSATFDEPFRPARFRLEHDAALRRAAVNEWTVLMTQVYSPNFILDFGSEGENSEGEAEFLYAELQDDQRERAARLRLALEAALERRLFAALIAESHPTLAKEMLKLANETLVGLVERTRLPSSLPRISRFS